MLHSHGADEYGPCVNSTYSSIGYEDPLESYVPYNPVHCGADSNTVGNFRFDITQWNTYPCTGSQKATHKDWVGFSCAVEPDWIDNDLFRGGHTGGLFKVRKGTHINIENRNLNGKDFLILDEVAGALGWALGALDPNETVKRTVAFMFCYGGKIPVRHGLYVKVTDDAGQCLDSTDPDAVITYTIDYGNADPNAVLEENVVLTVTLPVDADRFSSVQVSGDGVYDLITNTATWQIGTLAVNDGGQESVSFKVVHPKAGGEIIGKAVLRNELNLAQYTRRTKVCRYDLGPIVYVDKFAPGNGEGSSWQDAFRDLQEALDYARTSGFNVEEIWIARGTYWPGVEDEDCFKIPAGVAVYGGFAGHVNPSETKESRNWRKNRTTLSGFVLSFPDGDGGEVVYRNNTVVKMGDGSLLDGVTVEEGYLRGIDGSGVSSTLTKCVVQNNEQKGINCENGNMIIRWCEISENGQYGIYHTGNGKSLVAANCRIHDNQWDGIRIVSSTPTILNSVISQNGLGSSDYVYYGIHLGNPGANTEIRNNTIAHNTNEGIRRSGGSVPTVKNNIVYYNNGNSAQIAGLSLEQVYYCCVSDCNEINNQYNVPGPPDFVYDYAPYGYYHIKYESPCRNSGDYGSYPNETDMDGQLRVQENRVDIGADEVSCENTWHEHDWTYDGVINYEDFALFSAAWLSRDPNDPSVPSDPNLIDPNDFAGWNTICNLDPTGDSAYRIDLSDLVEFCKNDPQVWLWRACWREDYWDVWGIKRGGDRAMMMSMTGFETHSIMAIQSMPVEEKTIEQQILDLEEIIEFLEKIWLEELDIQEAIDPEDWKDFMDAVYNNLYELQT
jgi:parallel beta-helix repeat protein